jgi:hypothetical protein
LKATRVYIFSLGLVLAIFAQACNSTKGTAPQVIQTQQVLVESSTLISPNTQQSRPVSTATLGNSATPTPTKVIVTITAVNGNLAIRTGPDLVFDAIAILENGTSAPIIARSVMDGWVQIPIPSQLGKTGWVSIKTNYSTISGNVLSLPEIMTVEWPSGSYIQNCSLHAMLVQPGNKVVPPESASPANRVWFLPGPYSIYDMDMPGQPWVMSINLWQHTEFHITKDGARKQWGCP